MNLPQFITNIKNHFLYYKLSKMFCFKYATDTRYMNKLLSQNTDGNKSGRFGVGKSNWRGYL